MPDEDTGEPTADDYAAYVAEHANQTADAAPAAGYVPSEGRTVERPAPSPHQQFADFLRRGLGYAQ